RIMAVEVDRHLLPALRETAEPVGVEVVEGDAMSLDWAGLLGLIPNSWTLVANLPYNIATPLVADLLDQVPSIGRMLVMVQREVGERLAAPAGSDPYGAVSVKVAYWATAKVVGRVPASVFIPRPAVESVLVDIERRPQPAVDPGVVPESELFELVRAGFGHRRKMLRKSLEGLVGPDDFECARIAPTARAEELDVAAWGRLAACRRRHSNS
ncbi:MAG: rRNA (adenine1518-N6/adenine1519-N6)-dimethyltransferase, partial [Acidimicrobiaceae bacterium]|nr:rRNA (adenine1518-N6/adenine1519-N6)-dimethyltransferase [Acidimicrobiaceae bacterium]